MTQSLHRSIPLAITLFASGLPSQKPLTAEFVEQVVERAQEKFDAVGLALSVVQDGEVLGMAASGECRKGVRLTTDSLFNIASCSKAFTAASIALLVAETDLGWDDRVVDRVPEFKMSDPWITAHMTIRDLLSHRCGLATFAGDLLWYGSDYDDAEVVRRLEKLPITQPFRGQFGYQNLMYLVAGIVVERMSGMSWEQFVQERFFTPLGMTASRPSAQQLPSDADRAFPHIDGEPVVDHEFHACRPAAAIYSSVHDLTPWIRMLLTNGKTADAQILGEGALREVWKPHVQIGGGSGEQTADFRSYGLGWFLSLERGVKVVEHDGGMPGFLSKVSLMPAEGFGFAVLNNSNDGVLNEAVKQALFTARAGGDGLARIDRIAEIGRRMAARGETQKAQREGQRVTDTVPSLPLSGYVGRFEDAVYGPAEVTLEDGQLHVVLVPSRRRLFGAMSHWHRDTFRVDFPDRFLPFALFRFDLGFDGKVTGFRIDCPIADFDFGALDFRKQDRAR